MDSKINIATSDIGFYKGFNRIVAVGSKLLIAILVILSAVFPKDAGEILLTVKDWTFANFGAWYIYAVAFFVISCLIFALIPKTGNIVLGGENSKPEFSRFSWFSMMFGAGIGVGMLTFSTAEPLFHFSSNPDTIRGYVEGGSEENIRHVYKWTFLHWGLGAWGSYAIVGLALAFFSYSKGLPLTIRSALMPIFGKKLEGNLGNIVDITAVIATMLGLSVTIGFGISQFAAGIFTIFEAKWMVNSDNSPTNFMMIIALIIIVCASVLSALSGVGRGIKWLSNINMVLSIGLLTFFLLFGSTLNSLISLILGIFDYIINLPALLFTYWGPSETEPNATLYKWQSLWWSVFYWAWWIAFAPFVGLFLARISKGRTIREFTLGAMIVPSLMCFTWFAFVGGTAMDLELSGQAGGAILKAGSEAQLFETFRVMVGSGITKILSFLVLILLFTYLVTSADSGILIINTISSGGSSPKNGQKHIVIWGVLIALLIAILLLAGGMGAIKSAMLLGALPFSAIMVLMGVSLFIALFKKAKE